MIENDGKWEEEIRNNDSNDRKKKIEDKSI